MTLPSTQQFQSYDGNGLASSFVFPFRVFYKTDLVVTQVDEVTLATTPLPLDGAPGFRVDSYGGPQGSLTLLDGAGNAAALPAGQRLEIERVVPYTQETSLAGQGTFHPEVHERRWDLNVMMIQQLARIIGSGAADARVLRLGDHDVDGSGAYIAKGNTIEELGPGLDQGAAVNLGQLQNAIAAAISGGPVGAAPMHWNGTSGQGWTNLMPIPGAPTAVAEAYFVVVGGSIQQPGVDFSIDQVNEKLAFAVAPATGLVVFAVCFGLARTIETPPPVFTSANVPAQNPSDPSYQGRFVRVKDAGGPEQLWFRVANGSITGGYSWINLGTGQP